MDTDTTPAATIRKRRQPRRLVQSLSIIGLLATISLLAAACGGGSKAQGAAGGSGTTTTVAPGGKTGVAGSSGSSTTQTELLQLAQCMRAHGVPTFPDPSATEGTLGAMVSSAGLDLGSPTVKAALEACQQYTPTQNVSPAQSAARNSQELQFAQCMRAHGVPNYPDPSASTGAGSGAVHVNLNGTGIDFSSPTVQAAITACGGLKQ
jgi:hypothetical protein